MSGGNSSYLSSRTIFFFIFLFIWIVTPLGLATVSVLDYNNLEETYGTILEPKKSDVVDVWSEHNFRYLMVSYSYYGPLMAWHDDSFFILVNNTATNSVVLAEFKFSTNPLTVEWVTDHPFPLPLRYAYSGLAYDGEFFYTFFIDFVDTPSVVNNILYKFNPTTLEVQSRIVTNPDWGSVPDVQIIDDHPSVSYFYYYNYISCVGEELTAVLFYQVNQEVDYMQVYERQVFDTETLELKQGGELNVSHFYSILTEEGSTWLWMPYDPLGDNEYYSGKPIQYTFGRYNAGTRSFDSAVLYTGISEIDNRVEDGVYNTTTTIVWTGPPSVWNNASVYMAFREDPFFFEDNLVFPLTGSFIPNLKERFLGFRVIPLAEKQFPSLTVALNALVSLAALPTGLYYLYRERKKLRNSHPDQ